MLKMIGKIVANPVNVSNKHNKQSTWKKVSIVQFDDDFCDYYRWFIKKEFGLYLNPPLRGTHVTLINDRLSDFSEGVDIDSIDNKLVEIYYDPVNIRSNGEHWWINAESKDIEDLREGLGLSRTPYFGLHITIGYATGYNLEISEYTRIYSINR